ncbi:MAG: Eco57I restriction-modification methylase domain-containing protein, partial [Candidatus Methylumidiphilus sp.]
MPDFDPQRLAAIGDALQAFTTRPLKDAALALFSVLGYSSDKTADFGATPQQFVAALENAARNTFNRQNAHFSEWRECGFLFQLTNDEIPSLAQRQKIITTGTAFAGAQIESFVFLGLELAGESWTRSQLAAMTRELNKPFPMPAIVLFRHGARVSLAVIDRRVNLRDSRRDVIDNRITLVKDIACAQPHRAHLDILASLAPENLGERQRPTNFRELYDAWIAALSIQTLNKHFYTELAYWFFWAVKQVSFPQGGGADESKRNAVAVIRLLTRLIFVWFIKEKRLIPEDLFTPAKLKALLKSDPTAHGEGSTYYHAILQNLFFATLNVEMGAERKWADHGEGMKNDRLIHSVYRYKEAFQDPAAALALFASIPFLNGGLFECLDRELSERDFQRNPELKTLAAKEGNGWVLRVDGFSRRKEAQPKVPNKLFFGGEAQADLNADLGTQGKRYEVRGLLTIFSRYKFTVDENTPVEEEVALDPELLGRVFENLLASYNDDTKTTARKQSGSFYTPREVVDYMVDEALIAYFERPLQKPPSPATGRGAGGKGKFTKRPIHEVLDFEAAPGELDLSLGEPAEDRAAESAQDTEFRLRRLLAYSDAAHEFTEAETQTLIAAIEQLKILNPACGSGAFPMGVLQKLVQVLKKLDPANALWKAQNRAPLETKLRLALASKDLSRKESEIEEAEASLAKFDRDFGNDRHADYTRKLYLIDKCIHGVDIQPIAVQIAKLRFFIALVVSQEVDRHKDNWGITALPNLETKIVAADSLTPIDRPAQMGLRDPAIDDKEKELAAASEHYFSARTAKTKRRWRDKIFELRDELSRLLEEDRFLPEGSARQLVQWNPFDQNAAADFFDPEWMFALSPSPVGRGQGEGCFDITIGNPPYVRQEAIKHLKDKFKANYHCFTGTADLYVYFYERAIKLLKPHGVFAFITSNKWYRAKYGEKLREWMKQNTRLRCIIDFGDADVFEAIAYPTIVIATRRPQAVKEPGKDENVLALNWTAEYPVEQFPQVFAQDAFPVPQAELGK